jgi:hypothetical protein
MYICEYLYDNQDQRNNVFGFFEAKKTYKTQSDLLFKNNN